jgi:hypothetical protein
LEHNDDKGTVKDKDPAKAPRPASFEPMVILSLAPCLVVLSLWFLSKIIYHKIISTFYKFDFKRIIGNSINIPLIFKEGHLPFKNPCIYMRNARPYIYIARTNMLL